MRAHRIFPRAIASLLFFAAAVACGGGGSETGDGSGSSSGGNGSGGGASSGGGSSGTNGSSGGISASSSGGGSGGSSGSGSGGTAPCTAPSFQATATTFALPPGYANSDNLGAFRTVFAPGGPYCDNNRNVPYYATLDMNGDAKPDLVVTADCADAKVGLAYWSVFLNTGSGFAATPTHFALPAGYSNSGGIPAFTTPAWVSAALCDNRNVPTYSLVDADGDGKLDLVITSDCADAKVGSAYWSVFLNTGSGFAATPTHFALPSGYSFPSTSVQAGPYCNGQNVPNFTLIDTDGDAKVDLVLTGDCNEAPIGRTYWSVFKNTGAGFAPTAAHFALPQGYSDIDHGPFNTAAWFSGPYCDGRNSPNFATFDVDGDRKPDLVVTSECTDAQAGRSYWSAFLNTGAGFAASATHFTLPSGYSDIDHGPFSTTVNASGPYCDGRSAPKFATIDVSSDGKPDLVVTSDCADAKAGLTYWSAFLNSGTGFGPSATHVALPPGYADVSGSGAFAWVAQASGPLCDGRSVPSFGTLDANGDGKMDLVVTADCAKSEVGLSTWLVFEGTCGP
jgi:hypothetical protein